MVVRAEDTVVWPGVGGGVQAVLRLVGLHRVRQAVQRNSPTGKQGHATHRHLDARVLLLLRTNHRGRQELHRNNRNLLQAIHASASGCADLYNIQGDQGASRWLDKRLNVEIWAKRGLEPAHSQWFSM